MIRIYLKQKRKFLILLILFSSYLLFPLLSLLIFSNSYFLILSLFTTEEEFIIYDANSHTLFTSRIPLSLYDEISKVEGIKSVSPEIISFSTINNELIIIRGIDIENFVKVTKIEIKEGRLLQNTDSFSAIVGEKLSKKLNLKVGQTIEVTTLANEIIEIEIIGKFRTNKIFDEEILVPLFIAAWINKMPQNYISFFRVKAEKSELYLNEKFVIKEEEKEEIFSLLIQNLLTVKKGNFSLFIKEGEKSFEELIIKEFKFSEYTLIGFYLIIVFISFLILKNLLTFFINEYENETKIFYMLGKNKMKIFKVFSTILILILSLSLIIFFPLIYLINFLIENYNLINIFGYNIQIMINFKNQIFFIISYLSIILFSLIYLYNLIKKLEFTYE